MNPFDPMLLLGILVLGGAGSALRLVLSKWEGYLPWGVLAANVIASFVAGFAAAYFSEDSQATMVALLVVGLAGGLSTFSSWAAAAVQMAAKDRKLAPVLYTLYTLILSSTAAYLGLLLG